MSSIDKLTDIFRQFPGIGPRQAKRFVYFLLTRRRTQTVGSTWDCGSDLTPRMEITTAGLAVDGFIP